MQLTAVGLLKLAAQRMGMIGPTKAELRSQAAMNRFVKLRARYDAAQTTSENAEHWLQADDLSANAANSLAVRSTLRRRSRYECANNCYAAGITLTLANDLVGSGPRLQMLLDDTDDNYIIEREFLAWCREVDLAAKLRTAVCSKKRDGEVFLRFITNPNHHTPVWMDIEVLEADQVTTPNLVPDEWHIDGITFDEWQNPESYQILRQHPGEQLPMQTWLPDNVPASQVLHWFRVDRPGQRRGVPEITPALPLFAQLRRYTLAVITAAETAADHAAILESTAAPDPQNTDGDLSSMEPLDEVQYTRGLLTAVPFGWKLSQLKAEQPVTTYGMFKQEILNEIARCIHVPYNVAAGNSAGYNYSSGRLDHKGYYGAVAIEQADCELKILDKIFRAWYAEARLIKRADGTPLVPIVDLSYRPWAFAWDPPADIDPQKTSMANANDLAFGMTTFQDIYGAKGQDCETQQRLQAKALGIKYEEFQAMLRQKLFAMKAESDASMQAGRKRRKKRRGWSLPRWAGGSRA